MIVFVKESFFFLHSDFKVSKISDHLREVKPSVYGQISILVSKRVKFWAETGSISALTIDQIYTDGKSLSWLELYHD